MLGSETLPRTVGPTTPAMPTLSGLPSGCTTIQRPVSGNLSAASFRLSARTRGTGLFRAYWPSAFSSGIAISVSPKLTAE
jgi:hypothetical protein